ncbi:Hypothetical protein R9X50_00801500 [Acrodontium crateriforme]|uniref:Iron-sulfur assembly protein 1 n=1 Tax=Acrodontium crateriforme TaxID=150365 RepID=A0AAQ3RB71_9PEZI|nr:Hypothetical protein R9X50_00801500 [Acrodontium crateriforme]
MAALRTSAPSIASIFRCISHPTPARRCAQCLKAQRCPFSSVRPVRQASKRPLMTESAQRPQTLEPEMPPPRNANAPPSSITSSISSAQQSWPPVSPWQAKEQEKKQSTSPSKSTTTEAPSSATQKTLTPAASPAAPKKSKLRPRKAAMKLTPLAVSQLKQLFEQPESKLIRVGVKNRGCSGLAYHLEYVDKPGAFDETVEQDGVKVLIDSKALFSIIGSEMDWVEDKLSARFVFRNPNITEQCGCGESFSIS